MYLLPFVGVAGVTSWQEHIVPLSEMWPHRGPRLLNLGIQVSRKSLNDLPTRHPNLMVESEGVRRLTSTKLAHPHVFTTVHYSAEDSDGLLEALQRLDSVTGPYLGGVQFNIPWVDPVPVEWLLGRRPDLRVILQINGLAMDQAGRDPVRVAKKVHAYGSLVTDALLDQSRGNGVLLPVAETGQYLQCLQWCCPDVLPGVAGGLGPLTLGVISSLRRCYDGPLSIDAQKELRNGDDELDVERVRHYLDNANYVLTMDYRDGARR